MATCNTNGVLKYYTSAILNGESSIFCSSKSSVGSHELKNEKHSPTMAPRIGSNFFANPNSNGESVIAINKMNIPNLIKEDVQPCGYGALISTESLHTHGTDLKACCSVVPVGSKVPRNTTYENIVLRRSIITRRLEACTRRLCHVRTRTVSLLTRLLGSKTLLAQKYETPVQISKALDYNETESSSDEDSGCNLSGVEQSWLCTRSVVHSNWHWLRSEIQRSEKILRNLKVLKRNLKQMKKAAITCSTTQCSRSLPHDFAKQQIHNLASPKYARILHEFRKSSDKVIRCSCIPPYIGPCILCCGKTSDANASKPLKFVRDVDLLDSAHSLSTHIHPKLSLSGDVQLALRLESRLAAFSSVRFRPHKSIVHIVPPWDKPSYLGLSHSQSGDDESSCEFGNASKNLTNPPSDYLSVSAPKVNRRKSKLPAPKIQSSNPDSSASSKLVQILGNLSDSKVTRTTT